MSLAERTVKILVIEDDFLIAESLASKLKEAGYWVTDSVASGEEALVAIKEQMPDLLLVDIGLAGKMDGIKTVEQITKIKQIPVIYLTGKADSASLNRAKTTQPSAYIIKPFNTRDLHIAIELAFHNAVKSQQEEDEASVAQRGPFLLNDRFFIKDHQQFQKVEIDDILWVEANRAYSEMVTSVRKYLLSVSLNIVHQRLTHPQFIRIHRSYIINLNKVDAFDGQSVLIHKRSIPVSKSHRQEFLNRFQFL